MDFREDYQALSVGFLGQLKQTLGLGFDFLKRPVATFDVEQIRGVGTFDVQRALGEKLDAHS